MTITSASPEIQSVRFYAVTGGKTRDGGKLIGTSRLVTHSLSGVLEGDTVVYPDGKIAAVLQDKSTGMTACVGENAHSLTQAAVGTGISNGDIIIDAGQCSMAVCEFSNGRQACVYLDEDDVAQLKQRGLL